MISNHIGTHSIFKTINCFWSKFFSSVVQLCRRKERKKKRSDACKGHSLPFEGELYTGARWVSPRACACTAIIAIVLCPWVMTNQDIVIILIRKYTASITIFNMRALTLINTHTQTLSQRASSKSETAGKSSKLTKWSQTSHCRRERHLPLKAHNAR